MACTDADDLQACSASRCERVRCSPPCTSERVMLGSEDDLKLVLDGLDTEVGGEEEDALGLGDLAGGEGLSLLEGLSWVNQNTSNEDEFSAHMTSDASPNERFPLGDFGASSRRHALRDGPATSGHEVPSAFPISRARPFTSNSDTTRPFPRHGPATNPDEASRVFPSVFRTSAATTTHESAPAFPSVLNGPATSHTEQPKDFPDLDLSYTNPPCNSDLADLRNLSVSTDDKWPKAGVGVGAPGSGTPKTESAPPITADSAPHQTTPFVTVLLNGIVHVQIPLPLADGEPETTSERQPLPPLEVFDTFRSDRSGRCRVQVVSVLPSVFLDPSHEWMLTISVMNDTTQRCIELGLISAHTPSLTTTTDLSFAPAAFTVKLERVSKVEVDQDPEATAVISAVKKVFHDRELNPRGGSMLIALLEAEARKAVQPEVWAAALAKHGDDFMKFVEAKREAFLLFTSSHREIETRNLDKLSAQEYRVALTLQEKQFPRPRTGADEQLELDLVKRVEEILAVRDHTQCELLDLLVKEPRFVFYLAPSFSTLMRFLGKHKDIFEWTMHPDKPTSIGLVGMLRDDAAPDLPDKAPRDAAQTEVKRQEAKKAKKAKGKPSSPKGQAAPQQAWVPQMVAPANASQLQAPQVMPMLNYPVMAPQSQPGLPQQMAVLPEQPQQPQPQQQQQAAVHYPTAPAMQPMMVPMNMNMPMNMPMTNVVTVPMWMVGQQPPMQFAMALSVPGNSPPQQPT